MLFCQTSVHSWKYWQLRASNPQFCVNKLQFLFQEWIIGFKVLIQPFFFTALHCSPLHKPPFCATTTIFYCCYYKHIHTHTHTCTHTHTHIHTHTHTHMHTHTHTHAHTHTHTQTHNITHTHINDTCTLMQPHIVTREWHEFHFHFCIMKKQLWLSWCSYQSVSCANLQTDTYSQCLFNLNAKPTQPWITPLSESNKLS